MFLDLIPWNNNGDFVMNFYCASMNFNAICLAVTSLWWQSVRNYMAYKTIKSHDLMGTMTCGSCNNAVARRVLRQFPVFTWAGFFVIYYQWFVIMIEQKLTTQFRHCGLSNDIWILSQPSDLQRDVMRFRGQCWGYNDLNRGIYFCYIISYDSHST